uniref:Ketoreductase domain-containing protein n=1 Tax=Alexandrium andersonii TaxID=327968 RepID=A0A7S2FIY6_9DINO
MAANRAGKTYFITGGASGLGLATAKLLVSQGANVSLGDKNAEDGKAAEKELGAQCLFVEVDVTDKASVRAAVLATVDKFKTLNGVINCAGVGSAFTTVDKKGEPHNDRFFDFVCKINLYGTFYGSSEGAAAMAKLPADAEGNRGVIINVASVAAFEGQKGQLAYSASKGAVVGMTLPMARDLARYGIRAMTIAPGIIDTPLMQSAAPKVKEGLLAGVAGPPRFGKPEEFALLAASIIDNGYLNGETIRMDGGIRFSNL